MQQNKPFDTNPYIAQQNTQVPTTDLGVQNTNPYYNQQTPVQDNSLLGTFDTQHFLVGALIGAAGAYLLTNENAQKTLFKTVAKGTALFSAGIEEMKERYEDAQAELEAEREG